MKMFLSWSKPRSGQVASLLRDWLPWLHFEAGALAKSVTLARVRPVLLDVTPADVTGPLTQFQATSLTDRADMLRLDITLHSLGSAWARGQDRTEDTRQLREAGLQPGMVLAARLIRPPAE